MKPSECDCSPCGFPAVADCQWYSEQMKTQTASFCQFHVDDLWERIKPLVTVGVVTFRIDAVGRIKR